MKIKVFHQRRHPTLGIQPASLLRRFGVASEVLPTGGYTAVFVYNEEGECVSCGVAVCSEKDNYNKTIGRNIATGRALKKLNV